MLIDTSVTIVVACFYSFFMSVLAALSIIYLFLGRSPTNSLVYHTRAKMIAIFACIIVVSMYIIATLILLEQIIQQLVTVMAHYTTQDSAFSRFNYFIAVTNDSSDLILVALILFFMCYHILTYLFASNLNRLKYGNHPQRDFRVRIIRGYLIVLAIVLITFLIVYISIHLLGILLSSAQFTSPTYMDASRTAKILLESLFAFSVCSVLGVLCLGLTFWKPIPEYLSQEDVQITVKMVCDSFHNF